MRYTSENPFPFKFQWLNEQGEATSVFRKPGRFDGEFLVLEETEIPAAVIVHTEVRDQRMILAVLTGDDEEPLAHLLIMLTSASVAEELKSALDVTRSRFWAKHHRETLEKKGLGASYRDAVCPICEATLVLSDMPRSPQLYCHFCDSLTTIETAEPPVSNEHEFKICEECGMYSKPRKFTIFYFYFLLVIYGWWSKATWRCPVCMRKEAWKMFFGNLPFVIGVPVALTQLFRCYGGDLIGGPYKGLDTGNIRARKGDLGRALELYRGILERVPHSAGLKYNLGMSLLAQGDQERAADSFELALEDCSNYAPAYHQLTALYAHLGETERLEELERIWSSGLEEEKEEDQPTGETV
jgi:hypothetical protein